MPLNTNLNINPYFDDYDANNQYYRILFRPSVAVQARELTQVQDILQNQIEQFGNWAFQNGDIVSGCSISDMPILPYVYLSDYGSNSSSNSVPFTISSFVNAIAVSTVSNLSARIIMANSGFVANYPNTNVIYLQYINTGNTGQTSFSNSELLNIVSVSASGNTPLGNVYTLANSTSNTFTTGNAHGVSVTSGTVFINGEFVLVTGTSYGLVNAFGTDAGNNVVGFVANETIITPYQDSSLFDGSLGYKNQNAPGAYRLKIEPYLVSVSQTVAANTVGFNPIAVYNSNNLVLAAANTNLYSIIEGAIADNIYNEAGNYVVNPFSVDSVSKTSNSTYMLGRVGAGLGYAQGYEINLLKTAYVDVRRGTDVKYVAEQQITTSYGRYVFLDEVSGQFNFDQYQTVNLYDTSQVAITGHVWAGLTPVGNVIGTAQLREFEYVTGTPGSNTATYAAYLFNVQMNSQKSFNQVNSLYFSNSGNKGVGDIVISGLQQAAAGQMFWTFGKTGLKTLRNLSNSNNSEYEYRKKTTATLNANGTLSISLSSSPTGGVDELPYGVTSQLADSLTNEIILISQTQVSTSANLAGTVSVNSTSNVVVGSGTTFNLDFSNGEVISVGADLRIVNAITNSTYMTVDASFSVTNAAAAYYKTIPAGGYIPLASIYCGSRNVQVVNTSTFIINTGYNNISGGSNRTLASTVTATVYFNVLRTTVAAAKKQINKGMVVCINSASNPTGPWCLGLPDIHNLQGVYGASGTYGVTGTNLTSNFILDTGQHDGHYGLGYLVPKSGVSVSGTPQLTVVLDCFTTNTTSGSGFYTVDSYPIDDVNTANTTAITTQNLPVYVTSSGATVALRDVVDFRPVANATANLTSVVASATINPSNTQVLVVGASGPLTPTVSKNFQSDYQYYLPRQDMLFFSTAGSLKIKEGSPSDSPQSPLSPTDCMPVAVLNIPPFPSLTTDQMDSVRATNLSFTKQVRDTNGVSVNIITNRRYTMADIGTLDQRITNLETYVSLSMLEAQAAQLTITNAAGLNAFKNGIFVDPFTSHALGDVSNQEYRIAIDTQNAVARPFINRVTVPISYNSSNSVNVQKTGRCISLPYTSTILLSQPYATAYISVAPVAYRWNGTVGMYPSYSNAKDITNTGSASAVINTATGLQQLANSPFSSIFGDWNTTTTSSNTVTSVPPASNTVTLTIVVGSTGLSKVGAVKAAESNTQWLIAVANSQGIALSNNITIGTTTVTHVTNISSLPLTQLP